jgi:hypothetical protein
MDRYPYNITLRGIMILSRVREVLGSSLNPDTFSEILRGFPRSLQATADLLFPLCHDRFLPNPFQFMSHSTIRRYIV